MKGFISKQQRKSVYSDWKEQKPIGDEAKKALGEIGLEISSFKDGNGVEHRFAYKAPKNGSKEFNTYFGGSDLDLNHSSNASFLKQLVISSPDVGILVPIYPGFNEEKPKLPSEKEIKHSCQAILEHVASENNGVKFNLIGYSLGAAIAADMATKSEIKSDKLVMIAAPANVKDFGYEISFPKAVQKILKGVKKMFTEEYDTVAAINKIPKTTDIRLITAIGDQFTTTKDVNGKSHVDRICDAAANNKNFHLQVNEDVNIKHADILTRRSIRSDIANSVKPKELVVEKKVEGEQVKRVQEKTQKRTEIAAGR